MIIQVGPYPPPIGGISVYIKRMKNYLDSKGTKNEVWDISNVEKIEKNVVKMKLRFAPFCYLVRRDISLIHYNISGIKAKNYIGLLNRFLLKNRKKILTIHGECARLFNANEKSIIKSLNSFDSIICVKPNDKEYLLKHGIHSDVYEIPAFIPPTVRDQDIAEIPQTVWDFIDSHKPIISANAPAIRFCHNQDLYGIDMCIDLCAKLRNTYPQIGFVFCLPDIGDYGYFHKMKQRIVQKGIENNLLFQTKPCQFYPILMKSGVFLRPTNTDGDSTSIREALYLKTPVVTSDASPRPEGVVLFKNRDIDDFILKVRNVLRNYEEEAIKLKEVESISYADKVVAVYRKLGTV